MKKVFMMVVVSETDEKFEVSENGLDIGRTLCVYAEDETDAENKFAANLDEYFWRGLERDYKYAKFVKIGDDDTEEIFDNDHYCLLPEF